MKHLISLKEQSKQDLLDILTLAQQLKAKNKRGEPTNYLSGQTMIMLFQKTSTRTRLSFEAAMTELGGHAIFLEARTSQFALADFQDEIKSIMAFGQILMFRAKQAKDVELAASLNKIPVIDGCSEKYHPCQALGDILTMLEYSGGLEKIKKIAWLGINNNVANTLKLACTKLGIEVVLLSPYRHEISIDQDLDKMTEQTGLVKETLDFTAGLKNVNYLHTDAWVDMEFFQQGEILPVYKAEYEKRKKLLQPYQLNPQLLNKYCPQAKIMHCLPAHVGYEISREAIDHPNSIIFEQAANRLHVQKAIILWLLGKQKMVS